jgi:hypothetical protein
MKSKALLPRPRLILSLLAPLLTLEAAAQSVATSDVVRVEVRVQSDQDRKDLAKTTADQITQHKTLVIGLSGKAKTPETRTGKWTAYGRALKSHDVKVLDSGEFKIDFANGPQTVESRRISTTYTPEHATVSNEHKQGRQRQGERSSVKKVAAQGAKYVGYSVQVLDGGKVVGEASDPRGIGAK